jgi:acyl-CoA oxidase
VERTGGQGYLAVNRLGEGIAFAHSGITAEGDNRVLMQKVCKEIVAMAMKNKFQLPKMTMCPVRQMNKLENISDLETIFNFVAYREIMAMKTLQKATMDKMKEGKDFYDVWMKEDNDLVQSLATAYGERKVLEFSLLELQSMPHSLRPLMTKVFEMYGLVVLQ